MEDPAIVEDAVNIYHSLKPAYWLTVESTK
jgi:hypothetical protein